MADKSSNGKRKRSLADMSDEELIFLAQTEKRSNAMPFLIDKYRNLVKARARAYFLIGADRDDLIQEGLIGLYKAIRDFKDDKQASFRVFAELCITRQIITAVKTANRQKHVPLNNYVSLNKPVADEYAERTLLDILVGPEILNPEELLISREGFLSIEVHLRDILSTLEWKVLTAYLDGKSYQEMAVELRRPSKSIDNALQRVKKKVEVYLQDRK